MAQADITIKRSKVSLMNYKKELNRISITKFKLYKF